MRIMHYAVQYDAKRNHSLLLLVTAGMAGGGRDAIIFSSRHHCLICHLCHHCNSHHCHIHQNVTYIHIVNSIQHHLPSFQNCQCCIVSLWCCILISHRCCRITQSVFGVAALSLMWTSKLQPPSLRCHFCGCF